ncbi:hypothetical protein [Roseococcus sp.]|uniref:hypothetical protein n=1 Tax=Roseococcus sp. TaxID=2109646 RepID=UPI003BA8E9C0
MDKATPEYGIYSGLGLGGVVNPVGVSGRPASTGIGTTGAPPSPGVLREIWLDNCPTLREMVNGTLKLTPLG